MLFFQKSKQKSVLKINGFIEKHWQNQNDTTGREGLMKITILIKEASLETKMYS